MVLLAGLFCKGGQHKRDYVGIRTGRGGEGGQPRGEEGSQGVSCRHIAHTKDQRRGPGMIAENPRIFLWETYF